MIDLIFMGATGHFQSLLDSVLKCGLYNPAYILDDETPIGTDFQGYKVNGKTDMLPELYKKGFRNVFVSAGSIGGYGNREIWYNKAKELGFTIVNIIDPSAVLAGDVCLGEGVFVGKNAVINSGAIVGNMVIVNTGAIIEHGNKLEDFANIAPGTTLCGGVTIKRGAHIGAGSVVRQTATIGQEALVGIGSVVVHDIPDNAIAYGNPCRVIRTNNI